MLVVLASSARDNVLDQGFSTQPLVDTPSLLHAPQDLMSFKWANGHDDYVASWLAAIAQLDLSGRGECRDRILILAGMQHLY